MNFIPIFLAFILATTDSTELAIAQTLENGLLTTTSAEPEPASIDEASEQKKKHLKSGFEQKLCKLLKKSFDMTVNDPIEKKRH